MKFESSKGPKNVVDIKTGKPIEEPRGMLFGEDLDAGSIDDAFKAIAGVLSDEGQALHIKMGFREIKKIDKLSVEERTSREKKFINSIFQEPRKYLLLSFRKTYLEASEELSDAMIAGTITQEDFQMRQGILNDHLKAHSFVSDHRDLAILYNIFLKYSDAFNKN